jgi:invasion protein IalB
MRLSSKLVLLACGGAVAIAAAAIFSLDGGEISGLFNMDSSAARASTNPANMVMAQSPRATPPAPAAQPTAKPAPAPAPTAPRRTETINYDSWTVTCTDTVEKGSSKTCSGVLRVADNKSGQTLFAWIIGRDASGVLRTVMNTPTGVMIQNGVELKFGNSQPGVVPYVACTPQQCEASIVMVESMLKEARSNEKATATIHAVGGRAINFEMSIKGIDKVLVAVGAK